MDTTDSALDDRQLVDAIEILYKGIIETMKENDYFVAYERLTNLADIGSTTDEAIENLKQQILTHCIFIRGKVNNKKNKISFKPARSIVADKE